MPTKLIDVEALNLRETPVVAPANVRAVLHLGQDVQELAPPTVDGWQKVAATLDGQSVEGYLKTRLKDPDEPGGERPSLRELVALEREALVSAAIAQWKRFRFGLAKETQAPYYQYVEEMWRRLDLPHDGRDTDIPWSAAAISFMVSEAAVAVPAYARFKYAASHSRYIHDAIQRHGQADAPFWGVRVGAERPEIGDIVARSREVPISFDLASQEEAFKSHTDIIVSMTIDEALAIGGNVSDSVGLTRYRRTVSGYLAEEQGVFALLRNRT